MAVELLFNGIYRLSADAIFVREMKSVLQNCPANERKAILSHNYLLLNPAEKSLSAKFLERLDRCHLLVNEIYRGLEDISIELEGVEDKGQQITPEKLRKGHRIRVLDFDGVLLLAVERHPKGGHGSIDQYWLYLPPLIGRPRILRLLYTTGLNIDIKCDDLLVEVDGKWISAESAPSITHLRDDFYARLYAKLPERQVQKLLRKITPVDGRLISYASLPQSVVKGIRDSTGVDIIEYEQQAAEIIEDRHELLSDENQEHGIGIVPGSIRIGFVKQGNSEEK